VDVRGWAGPVVGDPVVVVGRAAGVRAAGVRVVDIRVGDIRAVVVTGAAVTVTANAN
jgi:hypothetical protein